MLRLNILQLQLFIEHRVGSNPLEEQQNLYQPGDFVLLKRVSAVAGPSKLSSPFLGPYEVIQHVKNDDYPELSSG